MLIQLYKINSSKTCETKILDGLDIANINVEEDIPEINQDTSKTISFERDEETSIFSRDKELEKPDENILTTTQLQMAEQIRDNMEIKDPIFSYPKLLHQI